MLQPTFIIIIGYIKMCRVIGLFLDIDKPFIIVLYL